MYLNSCILLIVKWYCALSLIICRWLKDGKRYIDQEAAHHWIILTPLGFSLLIPMIEGLARSASSMDWSSGLPLSSDITSQTTSSASFPSGRFLPHPQFLTDYSSVMCRSLSKDFEHLFLILTRFHNWNINMEMTCGGTCLFAFWARLAYVL